MSVCGIAKSARGAKSVVATPGQNIANATPRRSSMKARARTTRSIDLIQLVLVVLAVLGMSLRLRRYRDHEVLRVRQRRRGLTQQDRRQMPSSAPRGDR